MAPTDRSTGSKPLVPVLEIDTLLPIAKVAIDGGLYELRSPDMLPLFDYKRLERCRDRIGQLMSQADITEPEAKELDTLLDRQCRLILDAPNDVHARLSDGIRMQVYLAFLELPTSCRETPAAKQTQTPATPAEAVPTGASSSVASSASTAVPTPQAG